MTKPPNAGSVGGLLIMAVYKKKKLNRIMYFIVYCYSPNFRLS